MEYPDCAAAIVALDSKELACHDFRAVRQAVMCKVWHSPSPTGGFSQAIREAWAAVEAQCPSQAPVVDFFRNPEAHGLTAENAVRVWKVADRQGNQVGLVTAYSNGDIDICSQGNCRNEFVVPGQQDNVVMAMQDILPIFGLSLIPEAG